MEPDMDLELKEKAVLVTGSSRGIGRGIAEGFLREEARVTITGRNRETVEHTVRSLEEQFGNGRAWGFVGDLKNAETMKQCVQASLEQWGRLNVLVANLGTGVGKRGWDAGLEEWNRLLDLNLLHGVAAAEAAIPALKESSGNIVFISSIVGLENLGGPPAYEAAKAALMAYAKYLARWLGPEGIRVNTVVPGNILFPGGSWEQKLRSDPAGVETLLKEEVPLNRFGTPEEVAEAVLYLASARAGFTTGACLVVDGGQTRSYH